MTSLIKSLFGSKEEEAVSTAATQIEEPAMPSAGAAEAGPIHVTDDTFDELVLNAEVPVLLDFWAPWCGPCRMVAPVVEELAETYDGQAIVAKVNTDENTKVAGQLGIMGIPTLILFKGGQEVDRVVGYAPRHVLEEKLKAVLN
jgi:thioredoxin 1